MPLKETLGHRLFLFLCSASCHGWGLLLLPTNQHRPQSNKTKQPSNEISQSVSQNKPSSPKGDCLKYFVRVMKSNTRAYSRPSGAELGNSQKTSSQLMFEKQHKMVGSEPTLSRADLTWRPATLVFKDRLCISPTKPLIQMPWVCCQTIHTRLLQHVTRQVKSGSIVLCKP